MKGLAKMIPEENKNESPKESSQDTKEKAKLQTGKSAAKEEKPQTKPAEGKDSKEPKAEAPKPEEKKAEKNETVKPSEEKPDKKPEEAVAKKTRPETCVICGKSIKKLWYYREDNYYCGKHCWKKSKKSAEKPAKEKTR